MDRRTLLRLSGVAAGAAVAGCTDGASNEEKLTDRATPTASPKDTAEPTSTEIPTGETQALITPIQELWTAFNSASQEGVTEPFHPETPHYPDQSTFTFGGTDTQTGDTTPDVTTASATWAAATGADTVRAGTTVTVGVTDGYAVSVIYTSPDGTSSFDVAMDTGPEF